LDRGKEQEPLHGGIACRIKVYLLAFPSGKRRSRPGERGEKKKATQKQPTFKDEDRKEKTVRGSGLLLCPGAPERRLKNHEGGRKAN